MSAQLAHRLAGEDGRVAFRTLLVACAVTAFLTAIGAGALSRAVVPAPAHVTRVVAVRTAQPGVRVPPVRPAAARPAPAAASPWAAARALAAGAAGDRADQLDPSPAQILAGGAVVADDLAAPCSTLTIAGAVARGALGCS